MSAPGLFRWAAPACQIFSESLFVLKNKNKVLDQEKAAVTTHNNASSFHL